MEVRCALCKKAQDAIGNLQAQLFRVNKVPKCLHSFCKKCLDNTVGQFDCPTCGARVKQNTLTDSSREAAEAELDAARRREIRKIYNRPESKFPTAQAYRDYEEEVEDIIFALVHGTEDEQAVLQRVEKYKREHAAEIPLFNSRRAEEEQQMKQDVAREKAEAEAAAEQFQADDREERAKKAGAARHNEAVMLGEEGEEGGAGMGMGMEGVSHGAGGGAAARDKQHGQGAGDAFAAAEKLNKKWFAYLSQLPPVPVVVPAPKVGAGKGPLVKGEPGAGTVPVSTTTTTASAAGDPPTVDIRLVGGLRYPECSTMRNLKELQASLMI